MGRRNRSHDIELALLGLAPAYPKTLIATVAAAVGVSKTAVSARARHLVDTGYLIKEGTTRPIYRPGHNRRRVIEHKLVGLAEDRVWSRDVLPMLDNVPKNVLDICEHGLTEMVNNAIDHSEGERVWVYIDRFEDEITQMVLDDGIGIFHKISTALDLPDERLALLELSKGKLTTDPSRHSGEGVFFTSRMFDTFQIHSGDLVFDHSDSRTDDFLFESEQHNSWTGTRVIMQISAESPRTAKEVFDLYSSGPDDYSFEKTVVPLRLARTGNDNLVSRSQAKRVLQRVDRFKVVMFDFENVPTIGQAFADEIFRVFAWAHPDVELNIVNASPEVQQMIRRAEVARDGLAIPPPPLPASHS